MHVNPLRSDLARYLKKHNLVRKFYKQTKLFSGNPRHSSLHTERLEPKKLKIYSLRIDKKYRAIFIFTKPNEIEVVDINDHYR